ncbi:MAG: hypothetical protein ACRBEQ_02425 [Hyphomonas sp.]
MNIRVAAAALAASALFAAPAFAEGPTVRASFEDGRSALTIKVGHNTHRGDRRVGYGHSYRVNEWGQTRREVRYMKQSAIRKCRRAIDREAWNIGFRDVDFDRGRRAQRSSQIGPRGFRVRFNDVEFEGRRRDVERDVTCVVRRGDVVRLNGIPTRGRANTRRDPDRGYDRRNDRRDNRRNAPYRGS